MEKEDQGNWEFVVPQKLKELYKSQDYGRYGKNGEMPVCFIVNTDNTGGNSGSPVFNSKGQLVGTAFDRNFEGLTGDIVSVLHRSEPLVLTSAIPCLSSINTQEPLISSTNLALSKLRVEN